MLREPVACPICPWGGKGDSGWRTLPGHAPHFLLGCHPLAVLLTSSAQAVSRECLKAWHFPSARWGDLLSSTEPLRLSLRKQEKGGFERETSIVGGPAVISFLLDSELLQGRDQASCACGWHWAVPEGCNKGVTMKTNLTFLEHVHWFCLLL